MTPLLRWQAVNSINGCTPEHTACSFVVDDETEYNLLIDIDSFLFEYNACSDLVKELMWTLRCHIGTPICKKINGKIIQSILKNTGQNTEWFTFLDKTRNLFIHNATPYIAVDVSDEYNDKYDLLIMKENLKEFKDKTKFIRPSDLGKIPNEFKLALEILEDHIVDLYA